MRIISWNVNGIKSMTNKIKNGEKKGSPTNNGIKTLIEEQKPDILCMQELKTQDAADLAFLKTDFKYILTSFSKYKKGYSGVALLTNIKPIWVSYGFNAYTEEELGPYDNFGFTHEGRIITARFPNVLVITAYVPNAQDELARIDERLEWERLMRNYLKLLSRDNAVPVIYTGDLNVAPGELDIHDKKNRDKVAGASKEERAEYKLLLEAGFVDAYRMLHPEDRKYTYFSNFANSRQNNKGWRLDMALVSNDVRNKIVNADSLIDYFGSDHVPIILDINI
jgi:exodeoxyribonuclease-3